MSREQNSHESSPPDAGRGCPQHELGYVERLRGSGVALHAADPREARERLGVEPAAAVPLRADSASRPRRRTASATKDSACATQVVEIEEKYAYSVKVSSGVILGSDQCGQLREQALLADPHVQRVVRLWCIELVNCQEAFGRRCCIQVDEGAHPARPAQPAGQHHLLSMVGDGRPQRGITLGNRCHAMPRLSCMPAEPCQR